MILVTAGGDNHSFFRLFEAVEKLISCGVIRDNVVMQTGNTKFRSTRCQCLDFLDMNEFEKLLRQSHLVISHAGAGTIMSALKLMKPIIVVPRLKRYNEHIDDHQLQLTYILAKQRRVIPVYNTDVLEEAIRVALRFKPSHSHNAKVEMIEAIESFCERVFH